MPTYDYECKQCRRTFEVRQRISDAALVTCDQCGGPIQRLLSSTPFILKGGGWYVTDYPSSSRKKGMEAEKSSTTASEKSDKADKKAEPATTPASEKSDKPRKKAEPAATPAAPASSPAATKD